MTNRFHVAYLTPHFSYALLLFHNKCEIFNNDYRLTFYLHKICIFYISYILASS